jgi:hypothetical protein
MKHTGNILLIGSFIKGINSAISLPFKTCVAAIAAKLDGVALDIRSFCFVSWLV